MSKQPITILWVEDNEADLELAKEALNLIKSPIQVINEQTGEHAWQWLMGRAERNLKLPDIILLDINMPRMNGLELLELIRNHPVLKMLPVIILTTSTSDEDVSRAYANFCNCYIVKPMGLEDFIQVITRIEDFWLEIVRLPSSIKEA